MKPFVVTAAAGPEKPTAPKPTIILATFSGSAGTSRNADACYRRALRLQPSYAEAYNNLANLLKEQGKLDEAVACYRRGWNCSRSMPSAP